MRFILKILNSQNKFIILLIGVLILTLLEMFSLGLIFPLVDLFLNDSNSPKYLFLLNYINVENLPLLFISLFTFKTIYSIYVLYQKNKFISNSVEILSKKITENIFLQSYSSFKERNTSYYLNLLKTETYNFSQYLKSYMFLIVDIFISFGILFTLIYINFFISIFSIISFLIIITSFNFILKPKLLNIGKKRNFLDEIITKKVNEFLINFSFIKAHKILYIFKPDIFEEYSKKSNVHKFQLFYNELPKIIIELLGAISVFIILSLENSKEYLPLIAIYLAGLFKLLPSINRIISSNQSIKYFQSSVDDIKRYLLFSEKNRSKNQTNLISSFDSLEFQNLNFKFHKKIILKDENIFIYKNKITGILGESGQGKTTILNILSGLYEIENAKVKVDNKNQFLLKNSKFNFAYLTQEVILLDESLLFNLSFSRTPNINRIIELLDLVGLEMFSSLIQKDRHFKINENGSNLSGGQKQRLGLVRALYSKPEILFLDEMSSAQDELNKMLMINVIKKQSKDFAVLLISHDKQVIDSCDYVYELKNSELKLLKL